MKGKVAPEPQTLLCSAELCSTLSVTRKSPSPTVHPTEAISPDIREFRVPDGQPSTEGVVCGGEGQCLAPFLTVLGGCPGPLLSPSSCPVLMWHLQGAGRETWAQTLWAARASMSWEEVPPQEDIPTSKGGSGPGLLENFAFSSYFLDGPLHNTSSAFHGVSKSQGLTPRGRRAALKLCY